MQSSSRAVALTPHPETRSRAVRRIDARVSRSAEGVLSVAYTLEGDFDRLRIPASRLPRFTERLWQHTCCEMFIRLGEASAYHEFNFSPSGEWAVFAFERYRVGAPLIDGALDPQFLQSSVRCAEGKLALDAGIALARLSPLHARGRLSLALSAVIEDDEGVLSYWALAHPPGKPDFHHPQAFALELAKPEPDSGA